MFQRMKDNILKEFRILFVSCLVLLFFPNISHFYFPFTYKDVSCIWLWIRFSILFHFILVVQYSVIDLVFTLFLPFYLFYLWHKSLEICPFQLSIVSFRISPCFMDCSRVIFQFVNTLISFDLIFFPFLLFAAYSALLLSIYVFISGRRVSGQDRREDKKLRSQALNVYLHSISNFPIVVQFFYH